MQTRRALSDEHAFLANHVPFFRMMVNSGRDGVENRGVVVTEAGSYLRLTDSCITQLKAEGPSRTCNESKEEE